MNRRKERSKAMILGILWTLFLGGIAGWIACKFMNSEGSMVKNIILGLIGGVVGSAVASLIGLKSTNVVGTLLISLGGACLVIYLYRIIAPKFKK